MVENGIIIFIASIIIYLNIVATYHVINSGSYDSAQKKFQLLLSWLVPLIGSVVVISFALSDKEYVRVQKDKKGPPAKIIRLITLAAFFGASNSSVSASGDNGNDITGGGNSGGSGGGDN